MERIRLRAEDLVQRVAASEGLQVTITYRDVFSHCLNNAEAVAHLKAALDAEGVQHSAQVIPMRGLEDFERFNSPSKAAMFFLGAGERHPSKQHSRTPFDSQSWPRNFPSHLAAHCGDMADAERRRSMAGSWLPRNVA